MKKSLIALAALATVATAAQAQSSVTVYGVIDAGLTTMSNVKSGSDNLRATGMTNGGLSTSRWGFRGTEDLGGGLKANFNLEGELLADNGSNTSNDSILFGRAAWVGLSGKFGDVKLGRQNTLIYATGVGFDPLGGNNVGGFIAAGSYGSVRTQNAVTYTTPTLAGATLTAQTGTATTTDGSDNETAGAWRANRNTGLQFNYANGPFAFAANSTTAYASTGIKTTEYTGFYGSYDFGIAKLLAETVETKTVSSGAKVKHHAVGVQVPVTTALKVNLIAQEIKTTAGLKPNIYAASGVYSLSKRTDLYAIYAQSNQDGTSAQTITNSGKYAGFNAVNDGINQKAFSFGVRHTF
jgi:predicted porin